MQFLQSEPKLAQIDLMLSKHSYFSRQALPGSADAKILKRMLENQRCPNKKTHPNLYHWYVIMRQFSLCSIQRWIKQDLYFEEFSQGMVEVFNKALQKNIDSPYSNSTSHSKIKQKMVNCKGIGHQGWKPQDQAQKQNIDKSEFGMTVKLLTAENLERLTGEFYDLRLKIRELRFNREQKCAFVRFVASEDLSKIYKQTIEKWEDVQEVLLKKRSPFSSTQKPQQKLVVSN